MKIRCITTAPFYEKGTTYEVGDEVDLDREEITRLGGAGLIRKASEGWHALPEDCRVTIVVLLYNTPAAEFQAWVDSLESSLQGAKAMVDVVVVENTGAPYADKTVNATNAKRHNFAYMRTEKNLGFAAGANYGASHAKGDVLVFLNDDMEFPEPWVDELIEPLRTDPFAGVAGADLQRQGGGDWRAFDRPDWVCGACFAVRRSDFQRFGGFDESYFFSWEETDYCRLVTTLGQKIIKTKAKLIHQGGETAEIASEFAKRHFELGRSIFNAKWGDRLRVVASMLVGNERDRYLPETVAWAVQRCEKVVIVDDASTDGTAEILRALADYYPGRIRLYRNETAMFPVDEHIAREWLHYKALKENPTHIMPLDADEEMTARFDAERDVLFGGNVSWDFPIVHLWGDRAHRRIDGMWGQQSNVRLYSVDWSKVQDFYCQPLHCGSAPIYAYERKKYRPDIALLHKGWLRAEDFERKKARNKLIDPSGYWEPQGHWFNDPQVIPFRDGGEPDRDFNQHKL